MTEQRRWSRLCYKREGIIAALRELELAVVSLDHLGSAGARLSRNEAAELLQAFVENWQLGPRLARVRHILDGPLLSKGESEKFYDFLEEAVVDVPTWSWGERELPARHRLPRRKTEMSED